MTCRRALVAAGLGVLAAASVGVAQPSPDFAMSGSHAGRIKIGVTKAAAMAAYRDHKLIETMVSSESEESPAVEIRRGEELLLTALLDKDRVVVLHVKNAKFAMPNGVKVGTTLRELRQKYPRLKITDVDGAVSAGVGLPDGHVNLFLDAAPGEKPAADSRVVLIEILGPRK